MVAHRRQSKKQIKITKIKTKQNKENKKSEKMKKILFRKKPHEIIMAHEYQI